MRKGRGSILQSGSRQTSVPQKVGADLTQGNVLRTLLTFAVPIVLTNLLQQIYSMVDLSVIGQYVGNTGTVGVSVGGELADIGTMMATAFGAGGQIYIAQLVGAKDEKMLKQTIGTMLTWMLLLSFLFGGCMILFHNFLLDLLNCPAEAYGQARSYLLITALGLPFICGYNAICGILRGMGEGKAPLYFIAVAAAVNIVLDLLLVAVIPLEAAGTAIATVLSQVGAFATAFRYFYRRREQFGFSLKLSYFRIRWKPLKIILILGIPKLVQLMCIQFTLLWCNSNINSYGMTVSATNSIGNKLQKLVTMFTVSFETAASAIIGQSLGRGDRSRARDVVWTLLRCTLVVAAVGSAAALLFPRSLFRLFTPDEAVLEYCPVYMRIMVITFFSAAFLSTFSSMVNGSGFAALGFALGIMDGVVFRVGFSLLFLYAFHLGPVSFFLGNALARVAPATISFIYFISGYWEKRKLLVDVPDKDHSSKTSQKI